MEKSEVVSQKDEKIKNSEAGDREKLRNEDEELRQRIEKVKRHHRFVYEFAEENDPAVVELNKLAGELTQQGEVTPKVHLILNPTVNAFAFDGEVYFYSGLLNLLETKDEVAAVMAHELVHLEEGHAKIRLDSQRTTSIQSAIASVGRSRIHEYEADIKATQKLNKAGYAPEATEKLMAVFATMGKDGIDFTHGSSQDRQSIQLAMMKAVDFENSGNGFTEKPKNLHGLKQAPHLYKQLEQKYVLARDSFKDSEFRGELMNMSSEQLIDYCVHLVGKFNGKDIGEQLKRRRNNLEIPESEIEQDIIDGFILLEVLNTLIAQIYDKIGSQVSEKEIRWVFINLISEIAGQRLSQVQFASEQLFEDYGNIRDTRQKKLLSYLPSELNITSYLLETFNSHQDLIDFLSLVEDQKHVDDFGFNKINRPYPYNIVWRFTNCLERDGGDAFFAATMEKFEQNGLLYTIEANGGVDYSQLISLFQGISESLNIFETDHLIGWIGIQLDRIFHKINKLIVENNNFSTPNEKEDALINAFLSQDKIKTHFKQREGSLDDMARSIARLIYKDVEWQDDPNQQKIFEKLNKIQNPKEHQFGLDWQEGNLEEILKFIDENSISAMIGLLKKLKLFRKYPEFSLRVYEKILERMPELVSDNDFVHGTLDAEYIIVPSNSKLTGKIVYSEASEIIKKVDEQEKTYKREVIRGVDLSEHGKEILIQIRMFQGLAITQNEEQTRDSIEKLVESIRPEDLNSDEERVLLLSSVHSLINSGGSGWTSYSEKINDDWQQRYRWESMLLHPTLSELRQAYERLYIDGNSIDDQLSNLNHFCESIAEVANSTVREPSGNWQGTTEFHGAYLSPMVIRVMENVSEIPLNKQSVKDLRKVHGLVSSFENRRNVELIRSSIELQIIKLLNFEEGLNFIEEILGENGSISLGAVDFFQENKIRSPEQLERASRVLEQTLEDIADHGNDKLTGIFVSDYVFENFLKDNAQELFEGMLESSEDDSKLRSILSKLWIENVLRGDHSKPYWVDIPGKNSSSEIELKGGAQHKFIPFETFVNHFYDQITQKELDIILRKVLISGKGVLNTREGKEYLRAQLLEKIDSDGDDGIFSVVEHTTNAAIQVMDPVRLYAPISALLREQLMIRPKSPGSNDEAASNLMEKHNEKIQERIDNLRANIRRASTSEKRQKAIEEQEKQAPELEESKIDLLRAREVLAFNPFVEKASSQFEYSEELKASSEAVEKATAHLLGVTEVDKREVSNRKIQAIEAVLEVAKSMGAVGVRFLQLLDQYIDIPPEMREQFNAAYDSMRGQMKVTAFNTLKREALKEGANLDLVNFWGNIDDLSEIIGGGSLMTVYIATLKNGDKRVVKVLNPNTSSFIDSNIADSLAIVEALANTLFDGSEDTMSLTQQLITDLKAWLEADIAAVDYEEDNVLFTSTNNGYSYATVSDAGERQVKEFKVPEMMITGSKYIKIEEYVEGDNITDLASKLSPEQYSKIAQGVARNFIHQLTTITESGEAIVHSDIHPGNIRYDVDSNLHWLDRGYFIKFTAEEVSLLEPIVESVSSGRRIGMKILPLINYIASMPENNLGQRQKTIMIRNIVSQLIKLSTTSSNEVLQKFNVILRNNGLRVPFKWTILTKNLLAIQKMQQRTQ